MCKENKNTKNTKNTKEEDENMNAYAIKPNSLFVASRPLKRTSASKENIERIKLMESHDFSFDILEDNKVEIKVTKKK